MQSQGACLLFPVALFGWAWWIYDAISQGWAGQVPGFPKPAAGGERKKKRDLSKRVKSGLPHGLGRFWIWVEALATSPANPSMPMHLPVELAAVASSIGGACLHGTTFCGRCLCGHDGRVVCLDSSHGRSMTGLA